MRLQSLLILSTKNFVLTFVFFCALFALSPMSARAGAADAYPTGSVIDRSTPENCLAFFIRATNEIRDDMEFFKKKREESRAGSIPSPTKTNAGGSII